MNGMKISFAVVAFVLVQGVAVIWYISKMDSKINILYDKFEKENEADVVENQVKMKLDLANLMEDVKQIKKDIRQANKKDREIMEQHEDIYKLLQESTEVPTGYNYD
jgi:flagellar biosynthesis/type III secretory pathway chaperone